MPGLERANNMIHQFIVSCSHSLRGPLKTIEGLTNLLQGDVNNNPEDAAKFLFLIQETALKMEHTLDELEQFLENTNRKVMTKPIDFRSLVKDVLVSNRKLIQENNVTISTQLVEARPLCSDESRLRLVIEHLVTNAVQFIPDDQPDKRVEIVATVQAGYCEVKVIDNGAGINFDDQNRVFDLFFRASLKSKGSGVGLYVVKEVVEKMGGSVKVISAPGAGSTFVVRLPNGKKQ